MIEEKVVEREESFDETQAAMYEAVKQVKQYAAALFKEIAALPSEPPRWYGFCFMHPDLCIGISTPFSLLPRWRYMIKKTATVGYLIIKFGWLTFSVRW